MVIIARTISIQHTCCEATIIIATRLAYQAELTASLPIGALPLSTIFDIQPSQIVPEGLLHWGTRLSVRLIIDVETEAGRRACVRILRPPFGTLDLIRRS